MRRLWQAYARWWASLTAGRQLLALAVAVGVVAAVGALVVWRWGVSHYQTTSSFPPLPAHDTRAILATVTATWEQLQRERLLREAVVTAKYGDFAGDRFQYCLDFQAPVQGRTTTLTQCWLGGYGLLCWRDARVGAGLPPSCRQALDQPY